MLVGHSIGGMINRQYAVARPHDVVGMVLVDSASEQQSARFPEAINASLAGAPRMLRLLSLAGDAGLLALFPGIFPPTPQLPADVATTVQVLYISSGKIFRTSLAEMRTRSE